MNRKGYFTFFSVLLALFVAVLTIDSAHSKSRREEDKERKQQEENEKKAKLKLYDDPKQPEVVRKTKRHPDADKLEVDLD